MAIMSITSPGTTIYNGDIEKARKLARGCNEYFVELVKQSPNRFGFFLITSPLTKVEARLAEIDYAFKALKADCITVVHQL
jgi:hypothetical protein